MNTFCVEVRIETQCKEGRGRRSSNTTSNRGTTCWEGGPSDLYFGCVPVIPFCVRRPISRSGGGCDVTVVATRFHDRVFDDRRSDCDTALDGVIEGLVPKLACTRRPSV